MTVPTDGRVYVMLADCGEHADEPPAGCAAGSRASMMPSTRSPSSASEPVDAVYENRKRLLLAEMRNLEIIR